MITRIGFIGLGIMGKPMARNLMRGGYQLVVHNRSRGGVHELVAEGAVEASCPKEASTGMDVVITMLPDDAAVEQVVAGDKGVVTGVGRGAVLVDMSTISPITVRRISGIIEEREGEMLDAPVSGGETGAIDGSLSIMVGGKPGVFDRVLPVFEKLGKNISHVGDHGAGQVAKAANQIIVGLTIEAVAEALIFAKKAGVDPAKVRKALLGGFAQSRILELHGQRMLDRNFEPGGKVRSHKKDNDIAIAFARELGIYLPGTSLVSQLWNAVAAQGGLDWDHSAMVRVLERMSHTEVCPG